ncbi:amidohydrolase, partial [Mycobacterium tuberculosis]
TTLNARDQPPAEVSDQRVSGLTGAVHGVVSSTALNRRE